MRQKFKSMHERGFTLMEMLVVIAIIAIIIAIGTPIITNVVKDADTEEFVSNAKLVEEAANMYYRDNGEYPTTNVKYKLATKAAYLNNTDKNKNLFLKSVKADDNEISEDSKKIILSQLVAAGVTNSEEVLNNLANDGKIRTIDYGKIADYSKVKSDDNGASEFVIIDLVSEEVLDTGKYGMYQNDIAGYVFSGETHDKSTGVYYSGAYKLTDDELNKVYDKIKDLDDVDVDKISKGTFYPYGFKANNIKQNDNGTADITLSWTNRVVDKNNNLETYKGFMAKDFEITYIIDGVKKTVTTSDLTGTLKNVPVGKVQIYLRGTKVFYAGKDINKSTKYASITNKLVDDVDTDGPDDGIDTNDIITKPGDGMTNEVCDICNIDEVLGGDQFDKKDELFKHLEEEAGFNADKVKVVKEGIKLTVSKDDRIVLKELKKTSSGYTYDSNRTALFIAKDTNVLIPKSPYLQADFQKNPYSKYTYIVEVYKNKIVDNSGATAPKNAVELFYTE